MIRSVLQSVIQGFIVGLVGYCISAETYWREDDAKACQKIERHSIDLNTSCNCELGDSEVERCAKILECWIWGVRGYNYANTTQLTLCQAQCEALCLDKEVFCEQNCTGTRSWIANCDRPDCPATCSVLFHHHNLNQNHLLHVPVISISQVGYKSLELSWNTPTELSPQPNSPTYTTIYIVEETHPDPIYKTVTSVQIKGWIRGTQYKVDLTDVCNMDSYRVAAINQFGSYGFSAPSKIPAMRPGFVENIHYAGRGVYFYKNLNRTSQSQFMAILQWDPPPGWQDSDVAYYVWNPMVRRRCPDVSKDSLPIFTEMKNQSRHILMTIGDNSIGCVFVAQVQAVSRCNVHGPWTNFTVDLSNCSAINGYMCEDRPFDPPGLVENVTLTIHSTPVSVVMELFTNPYAVNKNTQSPLLINLQINWRPPSDLGSQGVIHHYVIRSGLAERNLFPIPPTFIQQPNEYNVSNDIVELTFQLSTHNIPYTFGVQVVAVGPGQVIEENDWGLFPMYTIEVSRNDSGIGAFRQEGKVLLDEAGIVILYVNNTLPVHFLFDQPIGRTDNTSIDRFAVQWGPLVGPDEKMMVENKTIVPSNQTGLSVFLQHPFRRYGIKVMHLSDRGEPPSDEWNDIDAVSFALPSQTDNTDSSRVTDIPPEKWLPLLAIAGVIVTAVISVVAAKFLCHRQLFKNLERRLTDIADDTSENGDHYFIMRPTTQNGDTEDDIPTVVADHWELPHCCLKMGRVLGSGAFGQVIKGRVSKSLLMHRGIDTQTVQYIPGTHVTVAIKMLQDGAEHRQTEDFLKEIDMMKSLGYHRNIVSIMGCCTLRQPYCLVVEHVAHGDLLSYFRKFRQAIQEREIQRDSYVNQDVDMFSPRDLLSVARQVASGMAYLAQKGFVHRDLAARNVLIGENKQVKIGDFGLARYIYHDLNKIYVNRRGGKLPLRWMSPEAIFDSTFSTASDIWSFGIVLYEIATLGGTPYPSLSNTELLQALKHGYRMDRPDNCCQQIYEIMRKCWNEAPGLRPSFTHLCDLFTSMLEEDTYTEYFNFTIPLNHNYYRINSDDMDTDLPDTENWPGSQTGDISNQSTAHVGVIHEIPDEVCEVTEMSKLERQIQSTSYIDEPFRTRCSSVSSFDNGLYAAVDRELVVNNTQSKEDSDHQDNATVVANALKHGTGNEETKVLKYSSDKDENALPSVSARVSSEERTSTCSDEVFVLCENCSTTGNTNAEISKCQTCFSRFDLRLTPYDIHISERNDSAICSAASDDSDLSNGNQSEASSATSDEYLIPDSPFVAMTTKHVTDTESYITPLEMFDFDVPDSGCKEVCGKFLLAENPVYGLIVDEKADGQFDYDYLFERNGRERRLLQQCRIRNNDVWCFAETRF